MGEEVELVSVSVIGLEDCPATPAGLIFATVALDQEKEEATLLVIL